MDSSSKNYAESMILGNCLSCQGLVRVPSRAPANSIVRCPHCSESYRLAQILDQAVPELELVQQETEPEVPRVDRLTIGERETFVVPSQLSKGAKRSRHRRSSSSGSSERSRSSGGSESADSSTRSREAAVPSNFSRRSSFSTSRSKAPIRNPALEMVKVVVGGLLAIPIAYLLVLWLFGQDPLDVGPSISNIAPFLVPEKYNEENENVSPKLESSDESETDQNSGIDDSVAVPPLDPDRVLSPDPETSK
jgi:hypothetical protein